MVQPIQYQVPGVADPFANVVQGLRLGSSLAEMDAARAQRALQQQQLQQQIQQRQLAMEQQQRFQQAQQDLLTKVRDKTATFADYQQVASMGDEKQAASALSFFKEMNAQQQSEMLRDGLETMAALETDPAIGVARMREKATALRNSGQDAEAKRMDDAARIAELNPTGAVAAAGVMLSYLPGGDKALESYTKLQADRRAAELQPFRKREQTAATIIKEAESKLAPKKFLAALDLTNAQIAQAQAARRAQDAAAAKSGAEAARAQAQADQMAVGVIPADKRPEAESKFRKEYSDQTKGYQEVKSAYGRVLASDDSAVGDLSLIFGYMKMLDPGSVVREGEFATAQNAAGVPQRVVNLYNKIISGERLNDSQRKAFKGQAERLFKQAGQQESEVRRGLERIAKGYGLNTANIFLEPVESVPTAPERAPVTPTPVASSAPVSPTPEMRRMPLEDIFRRTMR